ncbi:MAG TPA: hypothetical protein VKT77_06640 [Chthonomonadaceae bacterium]|nr:hypothetical protein [Chthonomonadaceae bacterium]
MKRKGTFRWTPVLIWTGAAVLFCVGIAYTPAFGNGFTWTLPYAGTTSTSGPGVTFGNSASSGVGVEGQGTAADSWGVYGIGGADGVVGYCSTANGTGVYGGNSNSGGNGVIGLGSATGVVGQGTAGSSTGVYGVGGLYGVEGVCPNYGYGVYGAVTGGQGYGVFASAGGTGIGLQSQASTGDAIDAYSDTGIGVYGSGSVGLYGHWNGTTASGGALAGYFVGPVDIDGGLTVQQDLYVEGQKAFRLDHPLDPAHKYLLHSCIESNEMMNLYRGNVNLDSDGKATVTMPEWFTAENRDFSYQLTCVGKSAPVYIAKEIERNQFEIAGGSPGMKVCWQVTGARNDAYAKAHPLAVEVEKPAKEQGKYIRPELFRQPPSKGLHYGLRKPRSAPKAPTVLPAALKSTPAMIVPPVRKP